jgi:hypothetical protein
VRWRVINIETETEREKREQIIINKDDSEKGEKWKETKCKLYSDGKNE